jgi:hypothetical protein
MSGKSAGDGVEPNSGDHKLEERVERLIEDKNKELSNRVDDKIKELSKQTDAWLADLSKKADAQIKDQVDARIKSWVRFIKIGWAAAAALATVATFIGVHFFDDPKLRHQMVASWIVDVPTEIKTDDSERALDGFLATKSAEKILDDRFTQDFHSAMKKIVAYSYSSDFTLSPGKLSNHVMPFYKTSSDDGQIKCEANYANDLDSNKQWPLLLRWNDYGDVREFQFSEGSTAHSSTVAEAPKGNASSSDANSGFTQNNQTVKISLADTPAHGDTAQYPPPASVQVTCTMLIIGLAPYSAE